MQAPGKAASLILGLCLLFGLVGLGTQLGTAALKYREYERTVTVKGLSEREYPADIVIWPLSFTVAANDLRELYDVTTRDTTRIREFLSNAGIAEDEISVAPPAVIDKSAQQYGGGDRPEFRYTATQVVTVYSSNIDRVRDVMGAIGDLGRQGIAFTSDNYQYRTEYLFTRLNEIKPDMIEEATREARAVAEKFAADSSSVLGKIKQASQGTFSINDRDTNNPHIKTVRVVSTVEYYLSD